MVGADADSGADSSDTQSENASGELSVNAASSDDNDVQPVAPDSPTEDIHKEAPPADNANNSASENASVQAAVNNSNNNNKLFEEEIQRKIDAVKDFAFCQQGDDNVPVFPYVVALTGHRDAAITDAVKETAKNQLRSLAKAWGTASSNCFNALLNQTVYTRKYIQNNTVPLIALIGLEDEESGKIWSEIAADLRDNEHYNIKIVAVASIPFQTLFELAEKYPDRFSRPENKIDFNIIDGLIELPAGTEFEYLLEDYKLLESFCTSEKPHTKELFNMLLSNSHIYEMQFEEYRKFMCVHSHALLAFVNNIEHIQKQWNEFYSDDLDSFTSVDGDNKNLSEKKRQKLDRTQHELSKYEDEVKDAYKLKDLIFQVYKIRQKGSKSAKYSELKNQFELLASVYQNNKESDQNDNQSEDEFTRTEEMIVYKLLGNIKAKLNPYEIPHGISFASIGPVVCIHTKNKKTSNDCQSDKTEDQSCSDITIIVKDQPDDDEYTLTKSIPHVQNVLDYSEIREVFKKAGLANRACLNNFKRYSNYNDYNSTNDATDLKNVVDKNTDSLFKFCQYTRLLKSHYYHAMKITTFAYAIVAFLLLFGIAIISAYNNNSPNPASVPTFISIIPSILAIILIVCQIFYSLLNYHKLYHYFHALFVGIKVQLYWDLAGVDANVPEMFNLHQINETVWLRAAFNGLFVTVRDEKRPAISSDDNSDDPELQLRDYIDFHTKQLHKCTTIRENWVDSEFDDLIGIKQSSLDKLKQSVENELDELSADLESKTPTAFSIELIWEHLKNILNKLSPFVGQLACFFYLFPFIFFPIKNYIIKNQLFSDLIACFSYFCQSMVFKVLFAIFFVTLTFLSCLLIVYYAYRKASLKDLDIKRKHQLLYPFRRANLLLSIKLAHWKSALHALQTLINESNHRDLHLSQQSSTDSLYKYSHSHIINNSYRDYKVVLKELGRIKLAVCAEWYLGLKERRMIIHYNRTLLR
ncbi:MAG: hypothetical protein IKX40_07750 [Thermoguttaceae bacterium]|nr:hypothetical protein [Thermoguttaceae bacterium]